MEDLIYEINILVYINLKKGVISRNMWGCTQKFPDWPPGARTASGTAFCH